MRITTSMMTDRVIFNMQRSLNRFNKMQTAMSSGRRINKPSDDPIGTLRDLNYRTELARIAQYRKNISHALNWMGTYDSSLTDAKDYVSSAREIAVAMANGNYDQTAREASAQEVQSMLDQLVQLGNKEIEGRKIFGGFKTRVTPFTQGGNGVVYNGDQGEIQFEVESSLKMTINFDGQSTFLQQIHTLGENADVNIGVTAGTLLAGLNGGTGVNLGQITITDKNVDTLPVSTIDLSGATDVNDVITTINTQLAADGLTNITARLGDEGNNITLETTPNGLISNSTLLARLNSGNGVDLSDGRILVTDNAGINVQVDLSGAQTVGDVISSFNSQLNAQLSGMGYAPVTMAINPAGTGFEITDTNGTPIGLNIEEVDQTSQLAENLGIQGSVGALMTGADLNPETSFEVAEVAGGTAAADLGLNGSFSGNRIGDDLDPTLSTTDLLADFNNRLGFEGGSLTIYQGTYVHTIDLNDPSIVTVQDLLDAFNNSGLDITASINTTGKGIQVVNNDTTRSFAIDEADDSSVAKRLDLFGGSDLIGTLVVLRNSLQKNDQEGTGVLLGTLEKSITQLLSVRSKVGARTIRLETTDSRMLDLNVSFTRLLSEEEDADMSELVAKLATFENNYRASLISASKIIQPSLLDFLR